MIWLDGSKRRSIAHVLSITYATINQKKRRRYEERDLFITTIYIKYEGRDDIV